MRAEEIKKAKRARTYSCNGTVPVLNVGVCLQYVIYIYDDYYIFFFISVTV